MTLVKFPVTSKNNNEYLVEISNFIYKDIYTTTIYIPYTNWFGKRKFKEVCSAKYFLTYYDGCDWNFNFIKIVKDFVEKYENKLKAREEKRKENNSINKRI